MHEESSGHSQRLHFGQAPEGPVGQLADVVPLELQHLQAAQPLEGEPLDEPQPVPVQLPAKAKQNRDTWSSVATTHAAPGPRATAARAVAPSPNGGPREQMSEEHLRGACSYRDRYVTFKAGARGRVSERGPGLGPGPLQ